MAGTVEGGRKAAETNRLRYGEDFYTKVGKLGGQTSRGGGFAADRERAREAGRKGGKAGKGKPKTPVVEQSWWDKPVW